MPPRVRSIADDEISLIKGMLRKGLPKTTIQAYFTHPDRPVNFGRITNIERETYGPHVDAASNDDVQRFIDAWAAERGTATEAVVESALDIAKLPAVDERRLNALFAQRPNKTWFVQGGETDQIECKKSFSLSSKVLRAVAALSNNKGGYILFGVDDRQSDVVGLENSKFQETDPNRFSQVFRSSMEPMPRFEIGSCQLDDFLVGAVFVHQEHDGPVIAIKNDQEIREGTIYYRYPGESRAIGGAEFRRILAERDRRSRFMTGESIARVIDLGPTAAVFDLASQGPEATKIVREGIDEADVLRNFVRQEKVEFPLAYFLRSCSTARSWLPIFYYLNLASISLAEARRLVEERETTYVARKRDLLARLRGEKSAYTKAIGRVASVLKLVEEGNDLNLADSRSATDLALALAGLRTTARRLDEILQLFLRAIEFIRNDKSLKADVWSYVYKASARIDELYFVREG